MQFLLGLTLLKQRELLHCIVQLHFRLRGQVWVIFESLELYDYIACSEYSKASRIYCFVIV